MRYRTRLLLAFTAATVVPLAVFAVGVRREMDRRLTAEYARRVAGLVSVLEEDLARQSEALAGRLAAVGRTAAADPRFRAAALRRESGERAYLLDYAGRAMQLAGLDLLLIQDAEGRILSSGHFRNEYDRIEPELPARLAERTDGTALVHAAAPGGHFLALARVDSLRIGGARIWLTGGIRMEPRVLARLARGDEIAVSLWVPGETVASDERAAAASIAGAVTIPYVETREDGAARVVPARLTVEGSLEPLARMRRGLNAWLAIAAGIALLGGLLLAGWASARVGRPLAALAEKTARLDLDRLDASFESEREDEIGDLSRVLQAMTERLRASTGRLREAERLAALGDLARQVNHDVKNGLVPLRNVVRHLAQVARDAPSDVARVLRERQGTLDSSLRHLESLAANYARLTPALEPRLCDVNAVVEEVVRDASAPDRIRMSLTRDAPPAWADRVVLRRILDNLVWNALESLENEDGTVTVSTARGPQEGGRATVRVEVADTGRGMTADELEQALGGFYTTRPGGTGLGLSIVRRLVRDSGARLHARSEPGRGSRFAVDFPAEAAGVAIAARDPALAPGPLTPPTPAAGLDAAPVPGAPDR